MDPRKLPIAVLMTLGLSDGCIFKPCLSMIVETGDSDDDSGADDSGADDSAADDSGSSEAARAAATQRVLSRGALPPDVAAALSEPSED